MADIDDRSHDHDHERLAAPEPEDARKPYEPPRLLKKRSVARATLFSVMGQTMNAITMMG